MKAKWATYFTHALLNGNKPSTLEQFRNAIAPFTRDRLVYLASVINTALQCWKGGAPNVADHAAFVKATFEKNLALKLVEGSQLREPHFVFHREQLLFVAKEAVLNCPENGTDPLAQPPGDLGKMFLMASDHLYTPLPEPKNEEENLLNRMVQLLPSSEYSGTVSFRNRIGRTYLMSTKFLSELHDDPDALDIDELFEKSVTLDLATFQALCFATTSRYTQLDFHAFEKSPSGFLLTQDFFRNTGIPQPHLERFRREVSGSGKPLKRLYERKLKGNSDFILFRDKPMFYTGDEHLFCTDTGFLIEKLESGPFWRVHNALPNDADKSKLHRFWGKLFERYVSWMITEFADSNKNKYISSPRYAASPEEEVCDGIVVCGNQAVFIECKGNTFTARSKYSGDPAALSQEIEEKLIRSQAGRPKGVEQLANAIERVFSRTKPELIRDLDVSKIHKVFPLLITRDGISNVLMFNAFLDLKFQAVFKRKSVWPRIVTPLCVLSSDSFEYVAPYLEEFELAQMISFRIQGDKSLKGSFMVVENSILDKAAAKTNTLLEAAFDEFANGLVAKLFPNETIQVQ